MQQAGNARFLRIIKKRSWRNYLIDSAAATVAILLLTLLIFKLHLYPRIPGISFVYLLVVLTLARRQGLVPAILVALIACALFDFFLVPPVFTFNITRVEEGFNLLVFLLLAVATSYLFSRLCESANEARQREQQARALYEEGLRKRAQEILRREHQTQLLYKLLQDTNNEKDLKQQLQCITQATLKAFSDCGVRDCTILLPDCDGKPSVQVNASETIDLTKLSSDEEASAAWVMANGKSVIMADEPVIPGTKSSYPRRVLTPRSVRARSPYTFGNDASALSAPSRRGLASGSSERKEVCIAPSGCSVHRNIHLIPLKSGETVVGVLRLLREEEADPQSFAIERGFDIERELSNPQTEFFLKLHDLAVSVIERARIQQESVQHELWRRTEEMQKSIISSISHDLRTPLSTIMGEATRFLQEDISWDDETARTAFQNIEHEAQRLDRFVRDLLDMSRIEGGKLKPKKVLCCIDGLIYETLEYMQPALQGRSVKIHVPDLPPLEIDRTCIGQVVQNLLENAMHYTPIDSPIEITATTDKKQVLISVADRGPGIKRGDEERIFDKFYRSKMTRSTDTGMGLGLAICRGLIEAHGGRIWAKNRLEGGAIFQFTLNVPQTFPPAV